MKKSLFTMLLFVTTFINAQTTFKKGYYIDSNNNKIEGLILDEDWRNSPSKIKFKPNELSETIELTINEINEFAIENSSKYVKFIGLADIYAYTNISNISNEKDPILKTEVLFLKVLFEGDSNLYSYENSGIQLFFFLNNKTNNIEQLIYKKYLATAEDRRRIEGQNQDIKISEGLTILENNEFRKQIYENVFCENFNLIDVYKLKYEYSSLFNYFKKQSECKNTKAISYKNSNEIKYALKAVLGANFNSYSIDIPQRVEYTTQIESQTSLTFGGEAEILFPFNNYKWSFYIQPTIAQFKATQSISNEIFPNVYRNNTLTMDYKYLQTQIAGRHYFYFNPNSKLYLNAGGNYRVRLNDEFASNYEKTNFKTFSGTLNFIFGIGFQYKKIEMDLTLNTNSSIIYFSYVNYKERFNATSILLKYNFL